LSVTSLLVNLFLSALDSCVNLPMSSAVITVFRKPDLSLFLEGHNGFTDFQGFRETRLCQKGKKWRRGPAVFCEMLSKPCGDNGVAAIKFPLLDLSKPSADVSGKRIVDSHTGHAVG